jgi:phage shock protein PspC (stress-responsive transcriptional regulator)
MSAVALRRDLDDALVGGVCAGLGDYFEVPTIIVRLAFIAATVAGGVGPWCARLVRSSR